MKTVLLRAPTLTQSGYGVHARQIARWLLGKSHIKTHFQTLPWGDTPWFVNERSLDGLVGQVMKGSSPFNGTYDVTFQLQLPNEWDPTLGKFNVGMTAAVETDRCNPEWIAACNSMNLIVVPSEHAKRNLLSHDSLTTNIVVVPEAFADACSHDNPASVVNLPTFSTSFNFLLFGQLTGNNPFNDRKNTFFTLKWMFEQFSNDPDVGIVIKTNSGRNSLIDRNNTSHILSQVIAEARVGINPRVHLLHGEMSDLEVAALYRHPQIKALVNLTRGEGYGLPILEAAASGLPVIATGWSGHMDFLNHGKFINVAYQLGEIHSSRVDNRIFMQGSRWANPIEGDFKKKIAKFRTSSSIPKEWALELQKKITIRYSFEEISKSYDEAMKDVL